MVNRLQQLLGERDCLLADGATGTNLFAAGLQTGDAPELWNAQHPDRIAALHRQFIEAGSDIVLTNSFGGNRYRLKLHQAEPRVAEINETAARIARAEADRSARPVLVGGSMGPTGEILEPLGALTVPAAKEAFAEQARALASGGVDMLWIETMSSREELTAALQGAQSTGLPVVCTVSFDTNGRTMMGLSPRQFAHLCRDSQPAPDACGSNCGVGPAELVAAMVNMARGERGPVLVAKANCGIPEWVDGEIRYQGSPELMAEYTRLCVDAGARIIGGCCGTTSEHIRAMRAALDDHVRREPPDADVIVAQLGEISTGARAMLEGNEDPGAGGASSRPPRRGASRGRRTSRSG